MTDQQTSPWEALPVDALPALLPHLPSVADEIIATIAREVPSYAIPADPALRDRLRRGVEQALEQFVEMVRRPGTGRAPGREVYTELGRLEAREGRSLESLLAAYRVGARVAWRRLAHVGLAEGVAPEMLVLFAESIFAYIDELSAESAEGYAQERAERAGEADRRRAALVELLVSEPPADPAAIVAAAEAAHWRLPRELALVVWPAELGRRPAARLPFGALVAPHEGLLCAVVPDPEGPGRRAELVNAFAGTPSAIGPVVAAADAARSLRRAVAALALAEDRLVIAAERRIELLCHAEPSLVAEMAAARLAPLARETPASRERLQDTLLAWLRHGGNVAAAAAELHVHAQTVRYRLARLRRLFGAALEDPDARLELELALRAGRAAAAA
jgi:hypothetical protein